MLVFSRAGILCPVLISMTEESMSARKCSVKATELIKKLNTLVTLFIVLEAELKRKTRQDVT